MPATLRLHSRPVLPAWIAASILGAALGALVLGVGGRLAMRGVSIWEGRARLLSVAGTLRVVAFGAAFGAAAGALRAAVDAAFDRWGVRRGESERTAVFAAASFALALVFLTPLTVHRLVLFPPVVALFVAALETAWRRTTGASPSDFTTTRSSP